MLPVKHTASNYSSQKKNILNNNRLSGWISYALAYANREEAGITYPFRFDQRNTINVVMNYQANSWFEFGLRFQYGSGFAISQPVGIKPRIILEDRNLDGTPETPVIATRAGTENNDGEEEVIFDIDYADRKLNSRLPEYIRLDLRFNFFADFWDLPWVFYLDIINVFNRSNVIGYNYYTTQSLTLGRETNTMFPIVPTLGFSVKF